MKKLIMIVLVLFIICQFSYTSEMPKYPDYNTMQVAKLLIPFDDGRCVLTYNGVELVVGILVGVLATSIIVYIATPHP